MAAVTLSEKVLSAKSIICDIEGTTTSISFVKDTLFPYALKNVEDYLKKNWNEDATKTVVAALREQAEEDKKAEVEGVVSIPAGDSEDIIADIVKNVEWQMSQDRKTGSLKTLQGLVWATGYKDGTIKGHVYDDVQKSFEKWTECGRKIYIYSSGSVDAQKLLFENSEQGDLLKYLAGHYDTKIGAKREKDSYESILKNIEVTAEEALFLTDVFAEAKAANEAGLNVVLLDRPGNTELSEDERKEFPVIKTFTDLCFEEAKGENGSALNGKRKIEETTETTTEEDKAQEPPTKVVKVEDVKIAESVENGAAEDKKKLDVVPTTKLESQKEDETKSEKEVAKMEVDGGESSDKKSQEDEANKKDAMKMDEGEKTEKDISLTLGAKSDDKKKEEMKSADSNELKTETATDKTQEETATKKESSVAMDVDEQDAEAKKGNAKETKESEETKETKEKKEIENSEDVKEKNEDVEKSKDVKNIKDVKDSKVNEEVKDTNSEVVKISNEKEKIIKESDGKDNEPKVTDKIEEDNNVVEKVDKSAESEVIVATGTGKEIESTVPAEEVATEAKKDETTEKSAVTSSEPEKGEKINGEQGAVSDKPPTNGSSAGDEEKNGDSDKENDTSMNNCETDEVSTGSEKTNGNTTVESSGSSVQEVATAEIKPKKVVDVAAPPATSTPPIEAES